MFYVTTLSAQQNTCGMQTILQAVPVGGGGSTDRSYCPLRTHGLVFYIYTPTHPHTHTHTQVQESEMARTQPPFQNPCGRTALTILEPCHTEERSSGRIGSPNTKRHSHSCYPVVRRHPWVHLPIHLHFPFTCCPLLTGSTFFLFAGTPPSLISSLLLLVCWWPAYRHSSAMREGILLVAGPCELAGWPAVHIKAACSRLSRFYASPLHSSLCGLNRDEFRIYSCLPIGSPGNSTLQRGEG
jgi:hypothetical protein